MGYHRGSMKVLNSIADLREEARRRVPHAIFEYADRGSYDENTLRRNREDFAKLEFRQRVMVDVSKQATATTILGEPWAFPLALELAAKYPGAIMPRLGLSKNDAADLITYLAARAARLSGPKSSSEPDPHSHHHHKH